jgi:sugar/nucleoside kinase (ribokinase family)
MVSVVAADVLIRDKIITLPQDSAVGRKLRELIEQHSLISGDKFICPRWEINKAFHDAAAEVGNESITFGGSAFNVLRNLNIFLPDLELVFVTHLGKGTIADAARAEASEHNIRIIDLGADQRFQENGISGVSTNLIIQFEDGDRIVIKEPEVLAKPAFEGAHAILAGQFGAADWAVLQAEMAQKLGDAVVRVIAENVREDAKLCFGLPTSKDFFINNDARRSDVLAFAMRANILSANMVELRTLFADFRKGMQTMRTVWRFSSRQPHQSSHLGFITDGGNDAHVVSDFDGIFNKKTVRVSQRCTVGAGDATFAALIAATIVGLKADAATAFASLVGSAKVRQPLWLGAALRDPRQFTCGWRHLFTPNASRRSARHAAVQFYKAAARPLPQQRQGAEPRRMVA